MSSRFQVSCSRLVAVMVVVGVAVAYGFQTWKTPARAEAIALGLEGKPFVLRVLVPWLAQGLMWLGLPANVALSVLVVCAAIGLFYGLETLSKSVR
jgi:hypothetical protein